MITGVFVYGDSFQQYLVAIIVPNWENVLPWAKANGLSDSRDQLLQNPKLMNAIMDDMAIVGKKEGLKGFEEVKKIRLVAEEFTVENGLLTPSFKVKRHQAKLKFKHLIDSMYSSDPKAKL